MEFEDLTKKLNDTKEILNNIGKSLIRVEKNSFATAKDIDNLKIIGEKMKEIIVKNDNGTNVIFHANKKKISEFKRLEAKQQTVGSPNSYTQAQSLDGLVQKNSSSVVSEPIIPQNSEKKPFKLTGKYKNSEDKGVER